MKLMKVMGADMAKFKAKDIVVHNSAVNMTKMLSKKIYKVLRRILKQ